MPFRSLIIKVSSRPHLGTAPPRRWHGPVECSRPEHLTPIDLFSTPKTPLFTYWAFFSAFKSVSLHSVAPTLTSAPEALFFDFEAMGSRGWKYFAVRTRPRREKQLKAALSK